MATYGEGDPTDNAQEFFDWLQEGSCELNGLNYAVSFPSYFSDILSDILFISFLIFFCTIINNFIIMEKT